MILTLRVTSEQGQGLPQNAARRFFGERATIGRGGGNYWVLPDPERLVSGQHAVVEFEDGSYYLTDTSTNGTFINDLDNPVGSGNRVVLNQGDRLYIGDYVMEVSIEADQDQELSATWEMDGMRDSLNGGFVPDFAPAADEEPTQAREQAPDEFAADREGELGTQRDDIPAPSEQFEPPSAFQEEIPSDWDFLSEGEVTPSPVGSELPEEPAISAGIEPAAELPPEEGSRVEPPPAQAPGVQPPPTYGAPAGAPIAPELQAGPGYPGVERQAPPPQGPGVEPLPPYEAPAGPRVAPGSQAGPGYPGAERQAPPPAQAVARSFDPVAEFLAGAGLDAGDLSEEAAKELMRLVGEIFGEAVKGLREALRARAEFKRGFRVQQTVIMPVENNPLKFTVGDVKETGQTLLFSRGSGYMPALDAVREAFQDIESHQLAMVVGMKAALQLLLKRFDPTGLEKQLEARGGRSHMLAMGKKAKLWDQYSRLYEALSRELEDDFQAVFGNEFCSAYEQQIRALAEQRQHQRAS